MGLNAQEVKDLLEYIAENNGWDKLYTNHKNGRKTPKYVNMKMDTRTGQVWLVEFRDIVGGNSSEYLSKLYSGQRIIIH